MADIEYTNTERYKMKPNVYGGKNMDEHIPQWNGYVEGDKQDETMEEPLIFDPKNYPPGTKVIVKEPCCPKCDEVYANCIVRSEHVHSCDFDWKGWAEDQYS